MGVNYLSIQISEEQASKIIQDLYNKKAKVKSLPGEIDFNFKIKVGNENHLLKISRPDADLEYIDFQHQIIQYVSDQNTLDNSPKNIADINGDFISKIKDANENTRTVRLLTWMNGKLWSSVNPQNENLLFSLGKQAGLICKSLQNFDHPLAKKATYLANRMKDLRILISTDGQDRNVLKIKPPMVFSKENNNELLTRLKTVFAEDFMTH